MFVSLIHPICPDHHALHVLILTVAISDALMLPKTVKVVVPITNNVALQRFAKSNKKKIWSMKLESATMLNLSMNPNQPTIFNQLWANNMNFQNFNLASSI